MLCPLCGKTVGDKPELCEECKVKQREAKARAAGNTPDTSASSSAAEDSESSPFSISAAESDEGSESGPAIVAYSEAAGFWHRFFAYLIDASFLNLVSAAITSFFAFALSKTVNLSALPSSTNAISAISSMAALLSATVLILMSVRILLGWLYFAAMESSVIQASFGKYFFALIVTDDKGQPLSFKSSSLRYFLTSLSILTLGIGFIMAGVTARKQALHDIAAHALVMKRDRLSLGRFIGQALVALLLSYFVLRITDSKEEKTPRLTARISSSDTSSAPPVKIAPEETIDILRSENTINSLTFQIQRATYSTTSGGFELTGKVSDGSKVRLIFTVTPQISTLSAFSYRRDQPNQYAVSVRLLQAFTDGTSTERVLTPTDDYSLTLYGSGAIGETVPVTIVFAVAGDSPIYLRGSFAAAIVR